MKYLLPLGFLLAAADGPKDAKATGSIKGKALAPKTFKQKKISVAADPICTRSSERASGLSCSWRSRARTSARGVAGGREV